MMRLVDWMAVNLEALICMVFIYIANIRYIVIFINNLNQYFFFYVQNMYAIVFHLKVNNLFYLSISIKYFAELLVDISPTITFCYW
jgi:hypothetical protein